MNLSLSFRMATMRLVRFRYQTLLMAFGIIVSLCATVLVTIALANFRERFDAHLHRFYPVNAIDLLSNYVPEAGLGGAPRLKATDVETVPGAIPEIIDWDPEVFLGRRIIKIGPHAITTTVLGYSDRAQDVRNRSVSEGEYFSAADVRGRARVALLGPSVASALFPDRSPIGQQIDIDGVSLRVSGVLESIGLDPHGENQDNIIYVPYTTLMEHVMKVDHIASAKFVLKDSGKAPGIARQVANHMHERIGRYAPDGQDFRIVFGLDMQNRLNQSFATIERFVIIAAVAGYGLSGIIILIVMLMNIRSRTSEIGLRKAVGAKSGDVQLQIFLEALIVAVCAAVLGLLLVELIIVLAAPKLRESLGLVITKVPPLPIALAVVAAVLAAILGALLPARRAAALDPVSSLRQN
jgi:putative ABC transport system permease protein